MKSTKVYRRLELAGASAEELDHRLDTVLRAIRALQGAVLGVVRTRDGSQGSGHRAAVLCLIPLPRTHWGTRCARRIRQRSIMSTSWTDEDFPRLATTGDAATS